MRYNLPEFEKIDKAIEYFNNKSNDDLMQLIDNEDEVLIQIALLNISDINSLIDAEKIINTLTEHSSETREYCSFLIHKLFTDKKNRKFFIGDKILEKFLQAISDVNPKVCRNILEVLPYYQDINRLYKLLLNNSKRLIQELQEKNKNKNYQYNTKSFRLYWNIFALGYTLNEDFANMYKNELISLITDLFTFKEYTLREKAAYLLKMLYKSTNTPEVKNLFKTYANDENFFVKEVLE